MLLLAPYGRSAAIIIIIIIILKVIKSFIDNKANYKILFTINFT